MRLIVFIVFVFVSFSAKGQDSAVKYFNDASKMYILGKTDSALQIVEDGLSKYPSDKKLKEMKKKLKEKEDDKKNDKKDEKKKEDENKDKKDNKGDKNKQNEKPGDKGQPKPMPNGIAKQRLENLLDAVNNEEKKIQDKVNAKKVKATPVQTEKDW